MAKRAGGHGKAATMPTGIEGRDIRPNEAGAHGNPQGEMRVDSASGLSADKGVHSVGNPAEPTGTGPGLRVGSESEAGVMKGGGEHTLEGQLRDKDVVGTDAEGVEEGSDDDR